MFPTAGRQLRGEASVAWQDRAGRGRELRAGVPSAVEACGQAIPVTTSPSAQRKRPALMCQAVSQTLLTERAGAGQSRDFPNLVRSLQTSYCFSRIARPALAHPKL